MFHNDRLGLPQTGQNHDPALHFFHKEQIALCRMFRQKKERHCMRGTLATIMLGLLLTTGCSTTNQMVTQDQSYNAPLSIYSAMDSTSLVYSDPMAASQANDNPYRWLGFVLHPVGHVVDYTVNRPLYAIAKHAPYIFGYTPEDSMIDSQRR